MAAVPSRDHHAALTRNLPLRPLNDASDFTRHDPTRLPDVHLRRAEGATGSVGRERIYSNEQRTMPAFDLSQWNKVFGYPESSPFTPVARERETINRSSDNDGSGVEKMKRATPVDEEHLLEGGPRGYPSMSDPRWNRDDRGNKFAPSLSRLLSQQGVDARGYSDIPQLNEGVTPGWPGRVRQARQQQQREQQQQSSMQRQQVQQAEQQRAMQHHQHPGYPGMQSSIPSRIPPPGQPGMLPPLHTGMSYRRSQQVAQSQEQAQQQAPQTQQHALQNRPVTSHSTLPRQHLNSQIETNSPRLEVSGSGERLWLVCQTVSRDETAAEDVKNTFKVKFAMEPHTRSAQVNKR
jgi:hypothetical protein